MKLAIRSNLFRFGLGTRLIAVWQVGISRFIYQLLYRRISVATKACFGFICRRSHVIQAIVWPREIGSNGYLHDLISEYRFSFPRVAN